VVKLIITAMATATATSRNMCNFFIDTI
jgi:hypothetical protein